MQVGRQRLDGLLLLDPVLHQDHRGFFYESFSQREFERLTGLSDTFVQDNHSRSARGVVRGLHYQLSPHGQGKLVRCVQGEVFDVVVDLRTSSATFGQWSGTNLSTENRHQLWIPVGFAHGYMALADDTEVVYKNTDYYHPEVERSLRWDDPALGIDWPELDIPPIIADKDRDAPGLADADVYV